jgi:hypothetical protein
MLGEGWEACIVDLKRCIIFHPESNINWGPIDKPLSSYIIRSFETNKIYGVYEIWPKIGQDFTKLPSLPFKTDVLQHLDIYHQKMLNMNSSLDRVSHWVNVQNMFWGNHNRYL